MNWGAFAFSIGLCVLAAGLEGALGGKELEEWLRSLKRPRFYAPLTVWILAACLTYLLQGVIAYRLFASQGIDLSVPALIVLIAVMAANVLYNVVLNRTRDPRWAYRGILWFLPLLLLLQAMLHLADQFSAMLNFIYVAWVVGYDLPIMRALWKRNQS
jgi:tryptophan-rich sensory protein